MVRKGSEGTGKEVKSQGYNFSYITGEHKNRKEPTLEKILQKFLTSLQKAV